MNITFPRTANNNKIQQATMRLFLIIFLYAGKSNDSVRDNIIGAVPIGFSSVNKEENDNKINDISKFSILHFFRG